MKKEIRNLITILFAIAVICILASHVISDSDKPKYSRLTLTKKEYPEIYRMTKIRVLIKNSGYESLFHDVIEITSKNDFKVHTDSYTTIVKGGDTYTISGETPFDGSYLFISSSPSDQLIVNHLIRNCEEVSFHGRLTIHHTDDGLIMINELNFDDYLCCVVPSEMPASYPAEALKAQAICARTYAAAYLSDPAYPEWNCHLDDSITFQVYNNIDESPESTDAVYQTAALVLKKDGNLADTFYYSTSCGNAADSSVWSQYNENDDSSFRNTDDTLNAGYLSVSNNPIADYSKMKEEDYFCDYITSTDPYALDGNEPWFRWKYESNDFNQETMCERILKRFHSSPDGFHLYSLNSDKKMTLIEFRNNEEKESYLQNLFHIPITSIKTGQRQNGGILNTLRIIFGNENEIQVNGEYNIRAVLSSDTGTVTRQDGTVLQGKELLPSAFFVIGNQLSKQNCLMKYTLYGGGYGHGVGMSQNAAKNAALHGLDFEEILSLFYPDTVIQKLNS